MSDQTSNHQAKRLSCDALNGKSAAATVAGRPLFTRAHFELLVEKAGAEYNAMPHPGLEDASTPLSRMPAKAAVERCHRHISQVLSHFERLGDNA